MAPNEALSLTQFSDTLRQAAVQDVQCEEPGEVFFFASPIPVQQDEEEGGLWAAQRGVARSEVVVWNQKLMDGGHIGDGHYC